MVYVDPKNLGYQPFFDKWMKKYIEKKDKFEILCETFNELFQKYIPPLINLIFDGVFEEEIGKPLEQILNRTNLNMVQQLTKLIDSMIVDEEKCQDANLLEYMFIFCMLWSIGSTLQPESRLKFEDLLRKLSGRHLPNTSLFDSFFDFNGSTQNWIAWDKLVTDYIPPIDGKFSQILVPTVDTKRFSYLLSQMIQKKKPVLFVGNSGTAKSVIISSYLQSLPQESFLRLNMNFSSRTRS
jgi:dynein heavy chain